MPKEPSELLKIITALSNLIGELLDYLPYEARVNFRKKYFEIMGEKDIQ